MAAKRKVNKTRLLIPQIFRLGIIFAAMIAIWYTFSPAGIIHISNFFLLLIAYIIILLVMMTLVSLNKAKDDLYWLLIPSLFAAITLYFPLLITISNSASNAPIAIDYSKILDIETSLILVSSIFVFVAYSVHSKAEKIKQITKISPFIFEIFLAVSFALMSLWLLTYSAPQSYILIFTSFALYFVYAAFGEIMYSLA